MRVVGLISGGKDSIFNLLQCVSAGHDIIALANIYPEPTLNKTELDSFMFQTVGHEGLELISEAIGLPLYRQTTQGESRCRDINYEPVLNDEVEDLFKLLQRVKDETACEGVAVGAIGSDYQRTRVENVCSRLGLTSLAYLWQQDQAKLLRSMIDGCVNAITVKVATLGLHPSRHLGISLEDLEPIVRTLHEKYGINVCGEGGEYETFVLDCPLFHKKIILEDTQVVQDSPADIAAVGHLLIKSARLECKFPNATAAETWSMRLSSTRQLVASPLQFIADCLWDVDYEISESNSCNDEFFGLEFSIQSNEEHDVHPTNSTSDWLYVHQISGTNIEASLERAKGILETQNLSFTDVAFVGVWLNSIDVFSEVNRLYVQKLQNTAPARACVALPFSGDQSILLDLIACKKSPTRSVVHVQSISHWAPASIGPYSQSIKVEGATFLAGQIPLVMGSMTLLDAPLAHQLRLTLRHCNRILEANRENLTHAMQITVFVAKTLDLLPATAMLRLILPNAQTLIAGVVVAALPRLAPLELVVVASEAPPTSSKVIENDLSLLKYRIELNSSDSMEALVCHVQAKKNASSNMDLTEINDLLKVCFVCGRWDISLRVFYNEKVTVLVSALKVAFCGRPVTMIPVVQCQGPLQLFTLTGLGSKP